MLSPLRDEPAMWLSSSSSLRPSPLPLQSATNQASVVTYVTRTSETIAHEPAKSLSLDRFRICRRRLYRSASSNPDRSWRRTMASCGVTFQARRRLDLVELHGGLSTECIQGGDAYTLPEGTRRQPPT